MKDEKETSDLIGQRSQRLGHLKAVKEKSIDPYPAKAYRTHTTAKIIADFASLENNDVTIVGRVKSWREHGQIIFSDIEDDFGKIQLYIKSDDLASTNTHNGNLGFDDLGLVDLGDFIEVTGIVTKTQRGEISVLPKYVRILTKAIRPLPNDIEDKEERFRRRYVDMAINPEIRERFKRRALFWKAHRDFLDKRGFSEINIPILEHVPGGGDAVPFVTHMNAIDEDFYLRISHELPLKRLIGAGFERVYDIGARFRNEGLSDEHLPEHVAMEFYWAYADWRDGMKLIQELYMYILDTVYNGKRTFKVRDFTINFSDEWEEIDFGEIFKEKYGIKDVYSITLEEVTAALKKENIEFDPKSINIPRGVDSLWKKIRRTVAGPAFLINHPKYLSPLQKPSTVNPLMVERFQPIIAGSELGNGWSEVNDPIDQYERFVEQQEMRNNGDAEAQWLDIDYVEMMEYGMPPNFGYGHSERVFWFLEDVTAREGVPFPQLKFHVSELTKKIYPEIDFNALANANVTYEQTPAMDLSPFPSYDLVKLDQEVKKEIHGIKSGYIIVENMKVNRSNKKLEEMKKAINEIVKAKFQSVEDLKANTNIEGFRKIYKSTGVDPNSRLNSTEALIRRIIKGKGLYNINTIVDTYNVTSAEFAIPMAAYDLSEIQGNIVLRFAKSNDTIVKIGDEEPTSIEDGEIVYADEAGVICLDYNYRDSDRTKITSATTKAIFFVDGHENVSEEFIFKVLGTLATRIQEFTGGEVTAAGIIK